MNPASASRRASVTSARQINAPRRWRMVLGHGVLSLAPVALSLALLLNTAPATAQIAPSAAEESAAERTIAVDAAADDAAIAARIERILRASGWFEPLSVKVADGLVSLTGESDTREHSEWAEAIARRTQDVAAVINHLEVVPRDRFNLSPAVAETRTLWRSFVSAIPRLIASIAIVVLAWLAARAMRLLAVRLTRARVEAGILRRLIATALTLPIWLLALFWVLNILGLTRLAATVVGGTGLLGLVIGIAFRDIAENFLASVLISIERPFNLGDLVEVAGFKGVVQSVTTRGTLLMTLEGNHVQIPNSTIYKSAITNFTANPITRLDFAVGIGYECSTAEAQELALSILKQHSAVLTDPEPLVLVEALAASTVNLRLYFWIEARTYSALKIKSSLQRLIKRAFIEAGISMPDDAREVIFPQGLRIFRGGAQTEVTQPAIPSGAITEPDAASIAGEGEFSSETQAIEEQSRTTSPGNIAGQSLIN